MKNDISSYISSLEKNFSRFELEIKKYQLLSNEIVQFFIFESLILQFRQILIEKFSI